MQDLIIGLNDAKELYILCQTFEDPRETLKIDPHYCEGNNSTIEGTMEYLIQSSGAQTI